MKFNKFNYLVLIFIITLFFTSCSNEAAVNISESNNSQQSKVTNSSEPLLKDQTAKNEITIDDSSKIAAEPNTNNVDTSKEINKEEEVIETIKAYQIPKDFVYVDDIIPNIIIDAKYYTEDNFIGKKINGYEGNLAILTIQASEALKNVQNDLNSKGLGLKIFDAYRPQMAVDHFVSWAADSTDTLMKDEHYPDIKKSALFSSGYIARKSGHSRGSTIDLTIINLTTNEEFDMGTSFDLLGVQAHFYYDNLSKEQKNNRQLLKSTMEKYGFRYYKNEWWHYTLNNEPYKNKYFNFEVK